MASTRRQFLPGQPVTGDELEAIANAQGVKVEPGDALSSLQRALW